MTARLEIARLDARYRVRGDAAVARRAKAQLDRVLAEVIDRGLVRALDDAALDEDAEICIRSLEIPLTLHLGAGGPRLVDAWSESLVEGVRRALETADDARVVRYPSITHAIVDLVEGLLRAESRRRWAWRQLGLATDAPVPALLAAVAERPERAMPVLRTLAARGSLAALAARMDEAAWVALAATALAAAGHHDGDALREDPADAVFAAGDASRIDAAPIDAAELSQVARTSRLLPALGAPASTGRARRAQAALVLLESAPHVIARPERAAMIEGIAAHLAAPRVAADIGVPPRPEAGAVPRIDDVDPVAAPAHAAQAVPAMYAQRGAGRGPDGEELATVPSATLAWPSRARAATRHGGLLLLLHVLGELRVPGALVAHGALGGRSLRWSLHQLALALAPVDASDPAALAFAGLGPDDMPPGTDEAPAAAAERAALADIARAVLECAAARIDAEPSSVVELCRRDACIVADPGWLEVHMQLTDVSTAVRRGGLDCNPELVPWLGVVVRFVYA